SPGLRSWRSSRSRLGCTRRLLCTFGPERRPACPQHPHSSPPAAATRGTDPGAAVAASPMRYHHARRFQRRVHLQSALADGIVLRPDEPAARLIDLPDGEARRLVRFLSAMLLVVITLVGFVRYYALMDQDSG